MEFWDFVNVFVASLLVLARVLLVRGVRSEKIDCKRANDLKRRKENGKSIRY